MGSAIREMNAGEKQRAREGFGDFGLAKYLPAGPVARAPLAWAPGAGQLWLTNLSHKPRHWRSISFFLSPPCACCLAPRGCPGRCSPSLGFSTTSPKAVCFLLLLALCLALFGILAAATSLALLLTPTHTGVHLPRPIGSWVQVSFKANLAEPVPQATPLAFSFFLSFFHGGPPSSKPSAASSLREHCRPRPRRDREHGFHSGL